MPLRQILSRLAPTVLLLGSLPAGAADLPFMSQGMHVGGMQAGGMQAGGQQFYGDRFDGAGAGGFRVARVPVRPAPLRYDVYGYPVPGAIPNPLAVGNGCPPALQPDYDASGNFAGYSPIPMCR